MLEREIEAYLRDEARAKGGRAYKFISPGNDGVPDRLVCLPGGRVAFVELKSLGQKSTPLQQKKQRELRQLGLMVYYDIDSKEAVDWLLRDMDFRAQEAYCGAMLEATRHDL